ncbi:hypothetical protein VPFG_00208 [Vibrio phage nt-1]|uniref:Uncharacterized protein n=1 Tax=Vibrio phage nt-1 TaxID=115992 RepID=R9TGI0_9CAUD|nr:hypothetical protein VPFG_00208 [Vibrio phage nt-1]AGN30208.1 hypothetical protein VPFG_00208 [Vibrio phage nt-1]
MKIIFLDIDGVLNNSLEADKHTEVLLNDEYYGFYSPRCVELLNKLVKETDAKIVLSSTWRHGVTIEEINQLFTNMGVEAECIGKTDDLDRQYKWAFRGNEILKWIHDNEERVGKRYEFSSYVILDDDTDMLFWQRNNYVNCDPAIGMTDRVVYKAKAILMKSQCEDAGQEFS